MLLFLALLLQVGIGGQAGISGYAAPAPVISALASTVDANTVVLSWATSVAADSRASCGTHVSPDNGVASNSTAHVVVVPGLTPSTAYSCVAQSGNTTSAVGATTTALATTTPITGISLTGFVDYNSSPVPACTMSGDTYYNTKSNDGVTYLMTMDTSGWNCGPANSSSLQLAKFTQESPNLVGSTVNYLTTFPVNYPIPTAKAGGLLSVAGNLYVLFNRLGVPASGFYLEPVAAGSLMASPDHGATWNNFQAPNTYTANGANMAPTTLSQWPQTNSFTNWSCNHFVMYGADDGTTGAAVAANRFNDGNAYVYILSEGLGNTSFCSVNNNDNLYLMRVPRSKIGRLNVTDYQYWVSGDGNLDSNWSKSSASAGTVISNTGQIGWSSAQYIPALNRYLLMTFYYPNGAGPSATNSVWLEYESASPWGPWTNIGTQSYPTLGYYSPIIQQDTALAATFGTTTMTVLTTQTYAVPAHYNLFTTTMTVNH